MAVTRVPERHKHDAGPTILVVDDDEYVAATVRAAVRGLGARLALASSASEGLALARRDRPDVAVVDIGLPDSDGYALIRALRVAPELHGLGILVLTGHALDEATARSAGADAMLTKPFRLHDLLATIRSLLGARSTS